MIVAENKKNECTRVVRVARVNERKLLRRLGRVREWIRQQQ